MSYDRSDLQAEANRRFEKIVRDVIDDLPVVELSNEELAFKLAQDVTPAEGA